MHERTKDNQEIVEEKMVSSNLVNQRAKAITNSNTNSLVLFNPKLTDHGVEILEKALCDKLLSIQSVKTLGKTKTPRVFSKTLVLGIGNSKVLMASQSYLD